LTIGNSTAIGRWCLLDARAALSAYASESMSDPTLDARLSSLTVPTLVLWGAGDRDGDSHDAESQSMLVRVHFANEQPWRTCRSRDHPPVRRRSTRDRPAKAPLSVEVVVDAALAILQSEGLEAVTMRRVGAALDTGAASLYVYVPSREGLLQAMLDRVIATIDLEAPDPSRWRAQVHSLLERMHQA
jgi:Bacterial regulatory proteins, tetR family